MQLTNYFEFEKFQTKHGVTQRIRIKGHRISIEHVLDYFKQGMQPDQIVREIYPSLTLEEVYATITYYLHNRVELDAYLAQGERIAEEFYREYQEKGPAFLKEDARAVLFPQAEQTGSPDS